MLLDLSLVKSLARNEMSGMRVLTSAPYSPTLTFEEMVVASRRRFLAGADSFCLAVFGMVVPARPSRSALQLTPLDVRCSRIVLALYSLNSTTGKPRVWPTSWSLHLVDNLLRRLLVVIGSQLFHCMFHGDFFSG